MKNLSIIITGQIRTFFSNNNFTNVLNTCINNYNKIIVICVINSFDKNDFLKIKAYFDCFKIHDLILIDYTDNKHQTDFIAKMEYKYNNEFFIKIRKEYMSLNTCAHREIYDPISCQNSIRTQFHQISIGFAALKEYIVKNDFTSHITMKTRFDILYPKDFYPHLPDSADFVDILAFNNINKDLITDCMKKYNLETLDDLIAFSKNQQQILPDCRINNQTIWPITFGGDYISNYKSLEYIKNNNNTVIYSFGDFFEFGETKNMLLFEKLFDDFWTIEPLYEQFLYHYYAPELQVMLFCLHKDIPILMYKNNSFFYVRQ
jgi:hypothetical protein